MFVTSRGDVARHDIAAVVGHAATIARRVDVRNGSKADTGLTYSAVVLGAEVAAGL